MCGLIGKRQFKKPKYEIFCLSLSGLYVKEKLSKESWKSRLVYMKP